MAGIFDGHPEGQGGAGQRDGWKGYSGLVNLGYKQHHRADHGRNQFVKRKAHLKECEFRFNRRRDNLYQLLLKEFKNNPLN